jgi:hypothetical protein
VPGTSAVAIATIADNPAQAVIYGYDKGAVLVDGSTPAPARAVRNDDQGITAYQIGKTSSKIPSDRNDVGRAVGQGAFYPSIADKRSIAVAQTTFCQGRDGDKTMATAQHRGPDERHERALGEFCVFILSYS